MGSGSSSSNDDAKPAPSSNEVDANDGVCAQYMPCSNIRLNALDATYTVHTLLKVSALLPLLLILDGSFCVLIIVFTLSSQASGCSSPS